MSHPPTEFDLKHHVFLLGDDALMLDEVQRLWSMVVVSPSIPDDREQWWLLETQDDVRLLPGLSLPTRAHLAVLGGWVQEAGTGWQLERPGLPWSVETHRFTWAARRREFIKVSHAAWQEVQAEGTVSGPHDLATLIAAVP